MGVEQGFDAATQICVVGTGSFQERGPGVGPGMLKGFLEQGFLAIFRGRVRGGIFIIHGFVALTLSCAIHLENGSSA
jgi:hypothetical protein